MGFVARHGMVALQGIGGTKPGRIPGTRLVGLDALLKINVFTLWSRPPLYLLHVCFGALLLPSAIMWTFDQHTLFCHLPSVRHVLILSMKFTLGDGNSVRV